MFFTTHRPATLHRTAYVPAAWRTVNHLLAQTPAATSAAGNACQATVEDGAQAWTLSIDVPGVSKAQLVIGIEAQVVRIETLADAPRQYKAAYELPQDIDATTSIAKLENGVLTLTLSKKQPVSNVTKITIN